MKDSVRFPTQEIPLPVPTGVYYKMCFSASLWEFVLPLLILTTVDAAFLFDLHFPSGLLWAPFPSGLPSHPLTADIPVLSSTHPPDGLTLYGWGSRVRDLLSVLIFSQVCGFGPFPHPYMACLFIFLPEWGIIVFRRIKAFNNDDTSFSAFPMNHAFQG